MRCRREEGNTQARKPAEPSQAAWSPEGTGQLGDDLLPTIAFSFSTIGTTKENTLRKSQYRFILGNIKQQSANKEPT